jgi:LPXTG-motif cell wall-anchored protein
MILIPSQILVFRPYPEKYFLRFQNLGNVHVVPYGYLEILDPFGKVIDKGILNEDSLDALPESIRRYEINLKPSKNFLIPGIYTAKIATHFGKTNTKLEASSRFFTQGSVNFIAIGILIVILVILVIYKKKKKT